MGIYEYESHAFLAYIKLKQSIYYETTDLFQRDEISEFENSLQFSAKIKMIDVLIKSALRGIVPSDDHIDKMIDQISCRILPKKISCKNDKETTKEKGRFLSNIKISNEYVVESLNYYISMPVELRIIDMLWSMYCGYFLDSSLGDCCYSNRLVFVPYKKHMQDGRFFRIYFNEYSLWRDEALDVARQLLKDKKHNVSLLSMDIKSCYYSININKEEMIKAIKISINSKKREEGLNEAFFPEEKFCNIMTNIILRIYDRYKICIKDYIGITHEEYLNNNFLPIGLTSSKIICNWYLKKLDDKIINAINPEFYGRYVDDILIVIKDPVLEAGCSTPIKDFMRHYFVDKKILKYKENGDLYETIAPEGMVLQEEKLIMHYLDKRSNKAALELFKKEIELNASIFRFLPTEESIKKVEEYAYDILYEGSTNKIRSIVGITENSNKLSKYIAQKIIEYRLTDNKADKEINDQLVAFFLVRILLITVLTGKNTLIFR